MDVITILSIRVVERIISSSQPDTWEASKSICRQTPQGAVTSLVSKSSPLAITAIERNVRCPFAFALARAARSAHIVGLYAAFSIFAPVKIAPSWLQRAAPTENLE